MLIYFLTLHVHACLYICVCAFGFAFQHHPAAHTHLMQPGKHAKTSLISIANAGVEGHTESEPKNSTPAYLSASSVPFGRQTIRTMRITFLPQHPTQQANTSHDRVAVVCLRLPLLLPSLSRPLCIASCCKQHAKMHVYDTIGRF